MFQRTKICSGLLLAFGSGLLAVAPGAFAQDSSVQRVEITGSSIKRVDAETSVPVTVITAEEFKKAGVTSTEQLLQQVSAVQVQQTSSQAVGQGTGGGSYADLRGLGYNKTLILLNGRRIANSAFTASGVDINTIPFAAIERVEVLRDGASALYGTDAIAGVINFITRRDYRGGTISVGVDSPQRPGGAQHEAQVGFGFGDLEKDGLNVFGFAGYQQQASIAAGQRHLAPHSATSSTTFPATAYVYNASGLTLYTPNAAPSCPAPNLIALSTTECGEDTSSFVDYVPYTARLSGVLSATFKLNEHNNLNLEAYVANSKVNTHIAPVPYATIYLDPSSPYYNTAFPTGFAPIANQANSTSTLNNGRIRLKFRDGVNGYREDDNTTNQGRFTAALDGNVADWDYNVAFSLNTTHTQDYLAHGYANESLLATLDTNPNSATYNKYVLNPLINPFGAQTAAGLAVLQGAQKNGVLDYGNGTVQQLDAHASRDIGDWLNAGRPAAIAVGFEGRQEKFLQQANTAYATQVYASTGVDPNTYNAGTRKVYAGFAELNVPILKSLDVTAAVRYDHYSDFGSTTNPKFSFRFQPIKAALLRGSYSTGFRAPSLYELYAAQTYTNTTGGQYDPVNCPDGIHPLNNYAATDVCGSVVNGVGKGTQFTVREGGNPNLKAEKSKNATLGLVLEPINNLTTEFDFYDIFISHEVGTLDDQTLFTPAGYAKFSSNFHYAPAAPGHNGVGLLSQNTQDCPGTDCGFVDELNQNLGSVRTNGVDIAIDYKLNAGAAGRFNFNLQSTWVHSYRYQLIPGEAYTQNVGTFADSGPVFRWQHNLTGEWTYGAYSLGTAIHHKSGYEDATPTRAVSDFTTFDLYGTYAAPKGFTLTLGVKNVANKMPPFTNYTGLFQQGYDPRFYDPTGRVFYGRVGYSF